jgi:hypothetical protein
MNLGAGASLIGFSKERLLDFFLETRHRGDSFPVSDAIASTHWVKSPDNLHHFVRKSTNLLLAHSELTSTAFNGSYYLVLEHYTLLSWLAHFLTRSMIKCINHISHIHVIFVPRSTKCFVPQVVVKEEFNCGSIKSAFFFNWQALQVCICTSPSL